MHIRLYNSYFGLNCFTFSSAVVVKMAVVQQLNPIVKYIFWNEEVHLCWCWMRGGKHIQSLLKMKSGLRRSKSRRCSLSSPWRRRTRGWTCNKFAMNHKIIHGVSHVHFSSLVSSNAHTWNNVVNNLSAAIFLFIFLFSGVGGVGGGRGWRTRSRRRSTRQSRSRIRSKNRSIMGQFLP